MEQMKEQADKIELIRHKIEDADAIVIGAGAGLSTAAGFTYSGDRFEKYFSERVWLLRYVFRWLL